MTYTPDILNRVQPPVAGRREELLTRLDIIETLSIWKLQLQAQLARKEVIFLFADTDVDFGDLADEVEAFRRVSKILTYLRGPRP